MEQGKKYINVTATLVWRLYYKTTMKELWNSVVSTECGSCSEGKVPQKPSTDHTTDKRCKLPVLPSWSGMGQEEVGRSCAGGKPQELRISLWLSTRILLGADKKPRRPNMVYYEFRLFPVMRLRKSPRNKSWNLNFPHLTSQEKG